MRLPEELTERGLAWGEDCVLRLNGRPWWRAPWPVDPALYGVRAPGDGVLVTGPPERAEYVRAALERLGHRAVAAAQAGPQEISAAAVCVFLGESGGPLPAHAMAALAARRVLVVSGSSPGFGLQAGIDHLVGRWDDAAVIQATVPLEHPRGFARMRALGALAARPHRADAVFARLAEELDAGMGPA